MKPTNKFTIIIATVFALYPCAVTASDFHELESTPKLSISQNKSGWPIYEVESVKYHLYRLFIKEGFPSVTYLLKEKNKTEITDGVEGKRSTSILELWELGSEKVENRIWKISQESHKWQFSGSEELVLINYGCCDSPNKYTYYSIKTGKLIRSVESYKMPVTK